ncbi:hypothetical protein RAD15_09685 [Bradyrhizobium sp. 14AA]
MTFQTAVTLADVEHHPTQGPEEHSDRQELDLPFFCGVSMIRLTAAWI